VIRRGVGIGILVAMLATGGAATAETSHSAHPPLAQALKGDAHVLYDAARDLFKSGDFTSAYAKFQRALELSSDPRLNWNLAACERKVKHNANVLRLIERYLHDGEGWLSEEEKKEATRAAAAVRAFVASASVTSQPAEGVEVYVDDVRVAVTPVDAPIWIDTGSHRVRFAKAGLRPVERTEDIKAGAELGWTVDLEHAAAPRSEPEATPAVRPKTPDAPETATRSSRIRGPLIVGGAGLAVAATGTVLVLLTAHQFSVLRGDCGTACDPSRWHSQRTLQTVGDVLLGVGAAAVVAGALWFVLSAGKPTRTGSAVIPPTRGFTF
jgi:hypothetical protein